MCDWTIECIGKLNVTYVMCECERRSGQFGAQKEEKLDSQTKRMIMVEKWNVARFIYERKAKIGSFIVNAKSFKLNACILSDVWNFSNLFSSGARSSTVKASIHFNSKHTTALAYAYGDIGFYFTTCNIIQMWLDPSYLLGHWHILAAMHGHCPITLLTIYRKKKPTRFFLFLKQRSQNCIHIMRLTQSLFHSSIYTFQLKSIQFDSVHCEIHSWHIQNHVDGVRTF